MPYPDSVSWYELALARNFADAGTGREEVVQVVREGVELVVRDAVQAHEEVVAEHRRDGDEQAERRHDQRLAHGTCQGVDRRLAAGPEPDQHAVYAPDDSRLAERA